MWLVAVVLAAIACGQVESRPGVLDWVPSVFKPESYIVGGDEAELNQFPFQAMLIINVPGKAESLCGGSLIDPQWVLTAAHCVQPAGADDFGKVRVTLGAHDRLNLGRGAQKFVPEKIIVPEGWKSMIAKKDLRKDIALIKLDRPAVISNSVDTIRLPSNSEKDKTFENELATISGWGRTTDASKYTTDKLRFVERKVISNRECTVAFGSSVVTDTTLCTSGKDRKGGCHGDSGGPLSILDEDGQPLLIGVVSFVSSKACEAGYPSGFIRVTKFLDWIHDNMKA